MEAEEDIHPSGEQHDGGELQLAEEDIPKGRGMEWDGSVDGDERGRDGNMERVDCMELDAGSNGFGNLSNLGWPLPAKSRVPEQSL